MSKPAPGLSIQGTDNDDVLTGTWDQDTFWGMGGDDVLRGEGGADTLQGNEGNDQLFGGEDDDSLEGGSGDDVSRGGAGNDAIRDASGGNDFLWGEDGDDLIEVQRWSTSGEDLYLSGGAGHDDILVSLPANSLASDLTIDAGSGDDLVRVYGAAVAAIDLGAGNDRLVLSGRGTQTITLGAGHDVVELGSMVASYIITDFTAGDQGDQIDLRASMARVGVPTDPERNPFDGGGAIIFQTGPDVHVVLGGTTIILKGVNLSDLTATNFSGADPAGTPGIAGGNFFGSAQGEQIWGSYGDDHIESMDGDDSLMGLEGDDVIFGDGGNDALDGGSGDDILYGGDGNDSFGEFQGGHGGDDRYYGGGGTDTFQLTRPAGLGDNVRIWGGDGDDYVSPGGPLGELFVDGGDGDDSVGVGNVNVWNVLGGAGDDHLGIGSAYRDFQLFFGQGEFDGGDGFDQVWLNEHSGELEIVGIDSNSFRVGQGIMHDVEAIHVGGVGMSLDISGVSHGLTVYAESGNNLLIGSAYDDALGGMYGDDTLDGGAGNDTAVFDLEFRFYEIQTDGGVTTVRCVGDAADVYGTDTLTNIERLQFADGWYSLEGEYIPAIISGSDGGDQLVGVPWSDTVLGGAGDDVIFATAGYDLINGGFGHDTVTVRYRGADAYKLLATGDDFLLSGPDGLTTLRGVEVVIFGDGTRVELNRMYDSGPASPGADGKTGEPLILPGLENGTATALEAEVRPGLLLRLEAGGSFNPEGDYAPTLSLHPDWS